IDGATGGTSPIGSLDASGASTGGGFPLLYNYGANLNTATLANFCFVPTASALDVENFDNASLTGKYVNGWCPNNPSSAETFIAQEASTGNGGNFNERHTRFTARNAEWLFNEMQNISNTLNCSSSCSPNTNNISISGSTNICNGSASYQLENAPLGANITWSATGNTTFAGGVNTGSSVTINNPGNQEIILTASINNLCGNVVKTKDINVGIPYWYSAVFGNSSGLSDFYIEPDDDVHVTVDPLYPYAIGYNWEMFPYPDEDYYIQNGLPLPSGTITGSSSHVVVELFVPGTYRVTVKGISECGESSPQEIYFEGVERGSNRGIYSYNIFPNPVSSELTVSYQTESTKPKTLLNQKNLDADVGSKIYQVKLINDKGTVLKDMENKSDNSRIVINTLDIPDGIYYLHIFRDSKNVIKKQIVIKH
ncbi:MAG TPA: T9SS type A sorting domain-containing protein, partial [Pelobium sp.]|nr:T9SS type A sorting domain-containing protein [Pelobium sp.]